MTRRQLPTGIQDFRTIRELDCYYVDKTPHIRRLVETGRPWFLSRPRRFGKSLLIDTLGELFEGNEALFRGLDIHGHWDWTVRTWPAATAPLRPGAPEGPPGPPAPCHRPTGGGAG